MRVHRHSRRVHRPSFITRLVLGNVVRAGILVCAAALGGTGALALLPATAAAEECPNAAFRTGPSSHLPDCRAYELVSPEFTDGSQPEPQRLRYDPEGTSVLMQLYGAGAVPGAEVESLEEAPPREDYTIRRTASGWVPVADSLSASEFNSWQYEFSGASGLDSQTTVWEGQGASAPANSMGIYERLPDHSIAYVGPALPPMAPTYPSPKETAVYSELHVVGTSADASEVFFSLEDSFWPFDPTDDVPPRFPSLYEYSGTNNTTPTLVGVSDGTTTVNGQTLAASEVLSACGVVLGGTNNNSASTVAEPGSEHNAVSMDGRTVFVTAVPKELSCSKRGPAVAEVFARTGYGTASAHTVAISEPSKEDCAACDTEAGVQANAYFEGASEDGSKVFFSTTQPLLGGDTSRNIYEYDFDAPAGERIVRVSGGDSTVSHPVAEVAETKWSAISEDGSHVYFLAGGGVDEDAERRGRNGRSGCAKPVYVRARQRIPGGPYHVRRAALLAGSGKVDKGRHPVHRRAYRGRSRGCDARWSLPGVHEQPRSDARRYEHRERRAQCLASHRQGPGGPAGDPWADRAERKARRR